MARKTSGGRARGPRRSPTPPVEDAEIVSEAEGRTDPDENSAVEEDAGKAGTSSVEAVPDEAEDAVRADAARPGAEGTSEVETPPPAEDAAHAADPSRGASAEEPVGHGTHAEPWEVVPGALTPAEAGHPEAVDRARIAPTGGKGTDIVRASSVEMVPPKAQAPEPEPEEPSAVDTPDVVITPPPTEEAAEEEAPLDPYGAGAAGAVTGAAAARAAGKGTPPDLDPPHAAPPPEGPPTLAGHAAAPRSGGFWPLLLGGLLAGLIGLGAGWLLFGTRDDGPQAPSDLDARIAELQAQVDAISGGPDLSPVNARIDEVAAGIPALDGLEDRLGAIETALAAPDERSADDPLAGRLDEVEGRFIEVESLAGAVGELRDQVATLAAGLADAGTGAASDEAGREALGQEITSAARRIDGLAGDVEALSAEFASLREGLADVETLPARVDEIAASADATRGEVDALVAERDRLVAEAEAAASDARAEAALERLRAAVDSGAPFAEPLAAFEEASGETAPEPLAAAAEDGVPSLAVLQDEWGGYAREALGAAPAEPGPGGFLRAQLGLRSLNEREGDSADAVLSRAEAALREGDLGGAVGTLDALSESPRARMEPWVQSAESRLAVTDALQSLAPASDDGSSSDTGAPAAPAAAITPASE